MPGESTPVYPDWFTSSVKAIYDPAKQGMTNYDVIEAYVEDFTNWNYVKVRGTVTISQHKFIITECVINGLGIVEDVREPYSNLTVRITGITDNQGVLITDYVNGQHQIINTITEDGIYTIEDRNNLIGFGCNFVGTCNITITQLPTSILQDLSGNGNHAYLYGGKGKLNSGMGVYEVDFTIYYGVLINQHTCKLTYNHKNFGIAYNKLTKDIEPYTVKVTGIRKEVVRFTYRNEEGIEKDIRIKNDGYYTLPKCYKDGTQGSSTTFVLYDNYDNDTEVIIEQIPDYPNQLCYDGKMYAVCYGFPILTDYTVMADRTWFEIGANSCFASKRLVRDGFDDIAGAFAIEYRQKYCNNFGAATGISFEANKQEFIVQTKAKYMDTNLNIGNGDDSDILIIGANNNRADAPREPYIGCHGKIIIADRSFTEEEIDWIKENIYNIKI